MLQPNDVVLFQGDSITDCGRDREIDNNDSMAAWGRGYAALAGASLRANLPAYDLTVINRGVSGDQVPDLIARWDDDAIAHKPSLISILIGVNDEWRFHREGSGEGVPLDVFETGYRQVLDRSREAMPEVQFVLCEPFVLRCGGITDSWFPQFDQRRKIVETLAIEYDTRFVPFQQIFDEAVKHAPPEYWAPDGVHPTPAGHALMAQNWMRVVLG